jgi:hypothetical protein
MYLKKALLLFTITILFTACGGSSTQNTTDKQIVSKILEAKAVDGNVTALFGKDNTKTAVSKEEQKIIGNWYGKAHYMYIALQLREDGSYHYRSKLLIGKFHNVARITTYEGHWHLAQSNSQVLLTLPNVEAPLVLTNKFPLLYAPAGVELSPGSAIDKQKDITIDHTKDSVTPRYTQKAAQYMQRSIADFQVNYFTMVAPKANSVQFWSSADILPMGYNYGHKLGEDTDNWNYALKRIQEDPQNYTMVISDENWQTLLGNRGVYKRVIMDPVKMYAWFEYFKDQMQILGKVQGTVLYIIAGDAPASWPSDIKNHFNNDPKQVPANLYKSRFPEVLERKPSNSFAGVFQMMDYLRMKYAPNVKLGYTIKTWGIPASKNLFNEPSEGWENREETTIMAEYFNNFDVQFDILAFNFNPRSKHTPKEYKSAAHYFGAVSKAMQTRDNTQTKVWIWKLSLWNQEQTSFIFQNIDFLVHSCNAIGVTLGHGNDLTKKSGFEDNPSNDNYLKSWIKEYYSAKEQNIPIHGTLGVVDWR